MLLKTKGAGYKSADLTLTFGPGIVRYLDPLSLVDDAGDLVLTEIKAFNVDPIIEFSSYELSPSDIGLKTDPFSDSYQAVFRFAYFPSLNSAQPVASIIRDLTAIIITYSKVPFKTFAYFTFHRYLQLESLALDEFFESYMSEESKNSDMVRSFYTSNDYAVVNEFIFRITPFVSSRIRLIEEQQQREQREELQRQEARKREDFERVLQSSQYDTFTYLMEDTRNGLIKIGKSRNPERREGTLQSEVPAIEMRFAIPAADDFESELHLEYSDFRRRGEWFELSSVHLKLILERMLISGDSSRAISSAEWVGKVFLSAHQ